MTIYWALTHLTSLPDPTKSIWDQDAVELDRLVWIDEQLRKEADQRRNEGR